MTLTGQDLCSARFPTRGCSQFSLIQLWFGQTLVARPARSDPANPYGWMGSPSFLPTELVYRIVTDTDNATTHL